MLTIYPQKTQKADQIMIITWQIYCLKFKWFIKFHIVAYIDDSHLH